MQVRSLAATACLVVASLFAAPARSEEAKPADPTAKKVTYVDDVQPIFREHCYTCHNQDEA